MLGFEVIINQPTESELEQLGGLTEGEGERGRVLPRVLVSRRYDGDDVTIHVMRRGTPLDGPALADGHRFVVVDVVDADCQFCRAAQPA